MSQASPHRRPSRSRAGFRVTSRDKEILLWIGRLRIVTAPQVGECFGMGRAVSYARLNGLVRLGLLQHVRIFHGAPGVYMATKAGLNSVDLELPPARVDLRTYTHDLELTTLVISLEAEFGAASVVTEREMRACDMRSCHESDAGVRFAVPLIHGPVPLKRVRPRLHFPDCAIAGGHGVDSAGVVAIELERTPKGRSRLRQIITSYVAARNVRAVRYYTVGERVRALVMSEVASQRAERLITVRSWPPSDHELATLRAA
jgi:hypothetical protein